MLLLCVLVELELSEIIPIPVILPGQEITSEPSPEPTIHPEPEQTTMQEPEITVEPEPEQGNTLKTSWG